MNNLQFLRKFALIIIFMISVFLFFLFWNTQNMGNDINNSVNAESFNVEQKLLIITEPSPFKDLIVEGLKDYYKNSTVLIEVVNDKSIAVTDAAYFNAILVLHRWEANAPTRNIQSFLDKNEAFKNTIIMLTTSWNGLEKLENVDALTGASVMNNAPVFTNKLIERIDLILENKKL